MELVGKEGHGAVENNLENGVHTKVDIEALERLVELENEEVSLRYILQKALVRAPRREGSRARKLAKRVGTTPSIEEQWQSPSVPREDFENAVAAAKLVVIQERRKPVSLC